MATKGWIPGISSLLIMGFAASQPSKTPSDPNFAQDIAPIVKKKCLPCHQAGGIGPFDFTTYRSFKTNSDLIFDQVVARTMPPTLVTSDFGPVPTTPPLTDEEIVIVQRYISAGQPEGQPLTEKLSRPTVPLKSTLTLKSPPSPQLPREGTQYWQLHVIDLPNKTLNLSAIDLVPNSPRALRSAQFYLLGPNQPVPQTHLKPAIFLDNPAAAPIGSWAPGYPVWQLPPDTTKTLLPGSKLLVVAKYQPSGKAEDSGFAVNISTQTKPAPNELQIVTFQNPTFHIKANDAPVITIGKKFTQSARIIGLVPRARFYCGIVTAQLQPQNQPVQNLLHIQRWDPYWMGNYQFPQPVEIPAGADLKFNFTYFNDDRCAINENKSPEDVYSGPHLDNEVCRMDVLIARPR